MNSKLQGATRSRMMWWSALLVIIGAVQIGLPDLREHIPGLYYGLFNMGVGIITAFLRWVTTNDLSDR